MYIRCRDCSSVHFLPEPVRMGAGGWTDVTCWCRPTYSLAIGWLRSDGSPAWEGNATVVHEYAPGF